MKKIFQISLVLALPLPLHSRVFKPRGLVQGHKLEMHVPISA